MWTRLRELAQEPMVALAGMSVAALTLLSAMGGAPPATSAAEWTPAMSARAASLAKDYTPRLVFGPAVVPAPPAAAGALSSPSCHAARRVTLERVSTRLEAAGI